LLKPPSDKLSTIKHKVKSEEAENPNPQTSELTKLKSFKNQMNASSLNSNYFQNSNSMIETSSIYLLAQIIHQDNLYSTDVDAIIGG